MLSILPKVVHVFTCKSYQKRNTSNKAKLNPKRTITIATVVLSFTVFLVNPVKAASFTFSQNGWQYGGNLLGSFTGDDLNGDGRIETSELSSFKATFSGNVTGSGSSIFPFTISHSFPPFNSNVLANLSFNYLLPSSELNFYSHQTVCSFVYGLRCEFPVTISFIDASKIGKTTVREFLAKPSGAGAYATSNSSSLIVVKPVQQSIPEPSNLKAILLVELSFIFLLYNKNKKVKL